MGYTNLYSISNNKMESDFDWLAKPPRQKLFKVIPLKDLQVHLVIHRLLKELGNNIKKKQEINLLPERDSKIVWILLDGIQIKRSLF